MPETLPFVTPNLISTIHVLVAFGAARLTAKRGFKVRHLVVSLMIVRNLFDALDGALAREIAKNHRLTDYTSFGYYYDGVCDSTGIMFFFVGCVFWLKKKAAKKGRFDSTGKLVFDGLATREGDEKTNLGLWMLRWSFSGVHELCDNLKPRFASQQ
jgi:hypothetical protein